MHGYDWHIAIQQLIMSYVQYVHLHLQIKCMAKIGTVINESRLFWSCSQLSMHLGCFHPSHFRPISRMSRFIPVQPYFKCGLFWPDFRGDRESFQPDLFILEKQVRYSVEITLILL